MTRKRIFFATSVLLVFVGFVPRAKGTSLPSDLENHRGSPSHRPSWPAAWFSHREGSSVSHLSSRERHERDGNNRIHGKHESQHQRSTRNDVHPAGARVLHDTLLRNSRSRYESETRERRRNFYDDGLFGRSENESSRHSGLDTSSLPVRVTNGEFIETRIAGPTTTTTTTTRTRTKMNDISNSGRDTREGSNESEKLTALAVAKYSGTRAVAYAGYHHHNFDYNPTRILENSNAGYGIVATAETPSYTKHHAGRRVCTRQTPNSIAHHHRSRQYRLVYTELTASTFLCCPGWSQVSRTSYGCNRPTCAAPCLNGGVCGTHGKCNCPKGYMGTQCQTDVDECLTEKPCGQICKNLHGSYECHCRHGFHLQPDGQSCRKNGSDGTAFEAHDLENDYGYAMSTTTEVPRTTPASRDVENEIGEGKLDHDYEAILKRLTKLEKQIAKGRKRETEVSELNTRITQAIEGVAAMRRAVDNVQLMQQEIYDMRSKVKQFELESRKLQHLTNRVTDLENRLKIRCRTSMNG